MRINGFIDRGLIAGENCRNRGSEFSIPYKLFFSRVLSDSSNMIAKRFIDL